jgi:hypothetical protein
MSHDANYTKGAQRGSMYATTEYDYSMRPGPAQYLKCYADDLLPLLDVEGAWTCRDVDIPRQRLSGLHEKDVIEKVGTTEVEREYVNHDGKRTVGVWQLTAAARERLETRAEHDRPGLLPCGHTGFINEGDHLACKTCEATHDTEVLR